MAFWFKLGSGLLSLNWFRVDFRLINIMILLPAFMSMAGESLSTLHPGSSFFFSSRASSEILCTVEEFLIDVFVS